MRVHKFGLVFENSKVSGYFSEKILNAYFAHTVPVYFGPSRGQVESILSPKAFIHCDLPANLTEAGPLSKLASAACPSGLDKKSLECYEKFQIALNDQLMPYFEACIREIQRVDQDDELYLAMVKESLIRLGETASR